MLYKIVIYCIYTKNAKVILHMDSQRPQTTAKCTNTVVEIDRIAITNCETSICVKQALFCSSILHLKCISQHKSSTIATLKLMLNRLLLKTPVFSCIVLQLCIIVYMRTDFYSKNEHYIYPNIYIYRNKCLFCLCSVILLHGMQHHQHTQSIFKPYCYRRRFCYRNILLVGVEQNQ